jgi:hypothetical protein
LRAVARAAGFYNLGIAIPGAADGQMIQLRYPGVQLEAGGIARVIVDLSAPGLPTLAVDRTGNGSIDAQIPPQQQGIGEQPPTVLTVRQLVSAYRETAGDIRDPATYGLVVGVLFDKPVSAATAEIKANYAIDANAIIGARLQPSGRVVYLYLERPIGALVARSLTVSNVADARGNTSGATTRPIVMALSDGGRVFGQVRIADGRGVPGSVLKLTVVMSPFSFDVSTIRTDANGSFDFDFVPRIGNVVLQAQHPTTLEIVTLTARIRGQGEQLLLNPTFQGRGLVRGRVIAPDGVTPVPNAQVALLPGSVLSNRGFSTRSDALGEFTFADAPVGVFTLSAVDASGGFGQTTGVIAGGGQAATVDVILTGRSDDGGRVVGRVFLADGTTPGAGFAVYVGAYDRTRGTISAVDRTTTDATGTFAFGRALPQAGYDVVAVDPGSQQIGIARASVLARQTTSVSVVLEATGAVEGVVFNARGEPVAGALVAGGIALVETDANGLFRIEGVPAGRRTIEAGDPVTRRRGAADVVVLAGQTVSAAVTLEARATVTGRVLDASGNPVPRATVRLPVLGGYTFVFANDSGVFRFPDLQLGEHLIQAPGPSRESLIEFMESNGYDPRSAFTAGDIPAELGGEPEPSFGDRNAILAAYQDALRTFLNVDESILTGLPMANLGGFGWNKVRLFQDSTTIVADVRFLAQGTVSGRTVDSEARPTAALTRVTGLAVSRTGFPTIAELGRLTTPAGTGTFSFGGIPRFDLATFQTAGVRGGDFTLEAATPFSPVIAQFRGQLTTTTPNLSDVVLQFPSATETNGTVRGRILAPGGGPAPANTQVQISFGDLVVLADAEGRFESTLPIPTGTYVITAIAPNGLRGQVRALVPAGGTVDVVVQLLGLGATTITVRRPNGQPVPGALVALERGSFPNDRLNGTADANGVLRFVNVSEGTFSVQAEEPTTGLAGRTSGTIVRDADVPASIVITASGRVTGRFLSADGTSAIPFAQVVLSTGGVRAFTTTDAAGSFELIAIPIGRFTVEASDPLSGRIGRVSDELLFEGQSVDVTVVQLSRGVVTGIVLQADGTTTVPGASVRLRSGSFVPTELQATARPDGSFRFEGVPAGEFTLTARDPLAHFEGTATGRLTFENEVVDRNVTLAPFGSLRVTVADSGGGVVSNAAVTIAGGQNFSRTAAVDVAGQATFEFLGLGEYRIVARSLANSGDGGEATAEVTAGGETVEATVQLRGAGLVAVTVVGNDGVTPVPSARVTMNASAAAVGSPPGALAQTFVGFTNGSGVVTFQSVPVGAFFATGESAALGGVSNGVLAARNVTASTTVRLGASGTVAGRVLLPDGITPAAQAIVTLSFAPQSTLQTGVLQVTTPLTGAFEFTGVPVGAFTLSAIEVVTSGTRSVAGALATNGQRVDLGDVILDNTNPRALSIDPSDRAVGVALQPSIAVTFSEPMRIGTFSNNVSLMDGAASVALQSPTFSNGNRTVTVRPAQPLRSHAVHTLTVRGGQDGPRDEAADLPLLDPIVSTFTTADNIPPAIVSVSPVANARQVSPETTVRVAFTEPVASATLTLRDGQNAPVQGQATLTAGNTAVAFAPLEFLRANTVYTATLSGVADAAGNALAGGAQSFTFTTIDTIAPVITALQVTGVLRAGAQVTLTPAITGTDVQRVEFLVGAAATQASSTAPFAITTVLPSAPTTTVLVTAFDDVGNRSSTFTQQLTLQPNLPPTIQLRSVAPLSQVAQGQTIEFEATATDEERLSRVALSAVGVASFSDVRTVPEGQATFTTRFTVQVPANAAAGGTLVVQAVAIDAGDAQSQGATLSFPVVDGNRPTVTLLTPVNNAQIVVGQPLTVTVDAADDVGVTSVTLTCAPVLAGCETRAIQPAVPTTRQTFVVDVPATATPGSSVTLLVSASDAAGNATQVGRTVLVPDSVAPVITALEPVSGSLRIVAGETVALRAIVSDNLGVTALTYQTEGGMVASGTAPIAPPVVSGAALFTFAVPASTANGSTITVRVRARDAAGNLSEEQTSLLSVGDAGAPTLTILAPASGSQSAPGQTITFTVRATDDTAVQRIQFTASGAFAASENRSITPPTASADASFAITLPAATEAGVLTLTAEAFDAAGNSSGPIARTVAIVDGIAPVVRIVSPTAGTQIDPRSPVSVVVEATDGVGVSQITFAASGAASATESRAVAPTATARTETFGVTFATPPAAGGSLTLTATARDAAGHLGNATTVVVDVLDVVAPAVSTVVPANNAVNVDAAASVAVTFSEAMSRATLNTGTLRLAVGATPVPVTIVIASDDRTVTLTPSAPMSVNAIHTVTVDSTVTDRAGNPLGVTFTSTFRTTSPDTTAPRVESIVPADNSVGVPTTSPVSVTFTEAIDPATITASSFRALVAGAPVTGTFAFLDGNRVVRFTPAAQWPFEAVVITELSSGIRDASGNALADATGQPLAAPLTFTFLTGNFAITSPATATVIERTPITLAAEGGGSLSIASVVFSVNGVALPADATAPFSVTFNVPARAATPSLTIVASARNAANVEIARAETVVAVVDGLLAAPTLMGLPRGATRTVRFSIAEATSEDLTIAVAAGDPSVATVAAPELTLPAGSTSVFTTVTACTTCPGDPTTVGRALGNTAIVATSSRGAAVTIVSVSDPVPGQSLTPLAAPAGLGISLPASAGHVFASAAQTSTLSVRVASVPHAGTSPLEVSVTSSNPAVATATASALQPGEQTVTLTIHAHANGIAVLTLRVGTEVRSFTIFVGPPPLDATPLVLAQPVGIAIPLPPSVGQVLTASGRVSTVTIQALSTPLAGGPLAVTVTSSNPAIATAVATAVQTGSQTTTLTITAIGDGFVSLTLRAGNEVRSLGVFVGPPPPGQAPLVFASPVGVSVAGLPFIGAAFAPAGSPISLGILLFQQPVAAAVTVTVTSSNPSIVTVNSPSTVVSAGTRMVPLSLTTGAAGTATITLEAAGVRREFTVVVGSGPTPGNSAVIAAPPVGVSVVPLSNLGRVLVGAGNSVAATLGVQLLTTARGVATPITISSSNPAVVSAAVSTTIAAGALVAPVSLLTTGVEGAAVLTFTFDGTTRDLLVVVGNPPPSQIPAVTAPVVGVRINP